MSEKRKKQNKQFTKNSKQIKLNISLQNTTKLVNDEPLVENLNRLEPDLIEASGIDQAIAALR